MKMNDYMERRVTSPTWGPPPSCEQALSHRPNGEGFNEGAPFFHHNDKKHQLVRSFLLKNFYFVHDITHLQLTCETPASNDNIGRKYIQRRT